jgi:hypothetical protein
MAVVKILAFGGMVPITDDRLLPDTAAALSQNCYLYTGQLVGMVSPKFIRNMTNAGYGRAYRIPNNYYDAEHIEDSTWMEFSHIDTDVLRSPIVDDQYDRYYWASPAGPPQVNSLARIKTNYTTPGSTPPYTLGVPNPSVAPIISSYTGGVGVNESRAYIVTWVTAFGEEGPPSPPVLGTGKTDATWNITMPLPLPADVTKYNLAKARIYRTIATLGATSYYLVAEVVIAATTFADNIPSTTVSANEINGSSSWFPPPSDLVGFVTMPNGMIAGWRNNELWFCEPYRPHAWPAEYSTVVEYPIIGLGVINQTLVVCTAGYPVVATGIHPDSISMSKLSSFEPCMSRGSILSTPEGVYYASPNGLVLVANGVANLVTDGMIQKDEWNNFNKIATLRATRLGNAYYAFGSVRSGFVQIASAGPPVVEEAFQKAGDPVFNAWQQDDFYGSIRGMLIDPINPRIAFNLLTSVDLTVNVFNDAWSGETLIIRNNKIYRLDMSDRNFQRDTVLWRSKIFQSPDKKNFAAIRVYFELPPWTPLQNPVRDVSEGQVMNSGKYGIVRVYANDMLCMTREIRTTGELMRIPSGFKADYWQVEIETVIRINSIQLGTSVKELLKA